MTNPKVSDEMVEAFNAWWNETEFLSLRSERAEGDLGELAHLWCQAAFQMGYEAALAAQPSEVAAITHAALTTPQPAPEPDEVLVDRMAKADVAAAGFNWQSLSQDGRDNARARMSHVLSALRRQAS